MNQENHEPQRVAQDSLHRDGESGVLRTHSARAGAALPCTPQGAGRVSVIVPELDSYEIVLFEYAD